MWRRTVDDEPTTGSTTATRSFPVPRGEDEPSCSRGRARPVLEREIRDDGSSVAGSTTASECALTATLGGRCSGSEPRRHMAVVSAMANNTAATAAALSSDDVDDAQGPATPANVALRASGPAQGSRARAAAGGVPARDRYLRRIGDARHGRPRALPSDDRRGRARASGSRASVRETGSCRPALRSPARSFHHARRRAQRRSAARSRRVGAIETVGLRGHGRCARHIFERGSPRGTAHAKHLSRGGNAPLAQMPLALADKRLEASGIDLLCWDRGTSRAVARRPPHCRRRASVGARLSRESCWPPTGAAARPTVRRSAGPR